MELQTRQYYIEVLWYYCKYKEMLRVLNAWSPGYTSKQDYQLTHLAMARDHFSEYIDFDELFFAVDECFTRER